MAHAARPAAIAAYPAAQLQLAVPPVPGAHGVNGGRDDQSDRGAGLRRRNSSGSMADGMISHHPQPVVKMEHSTD